MKPDSPGPSTEDPWGRLMARAQAGDSAAYRTLLRDCSPFLRAVVLRRVGNPELVEDIVQDVLLTLHEIRHTYDPTRPFKPWAMAVAQRRAIDALRRRYRRAAHEQPWDDSALEVAALDRGEDGPTLGPRALQAALAQLPDGQRVAIELLKLQDLSLKDAAGRTGQSEGALKMATHRAIKTLRRLLAPDL